MGDDLGQRIARLEATEEIKKLKSRYAQACDDNYNPETMRTIFSRMQSGAVVRPSAASRGRMRSASSLPRSRARSRGRSTT